MDYIELSFADAAANLACDEALLNRCESEGDRGILRIWEPRGYFVVLGYSNKNSVEVYADRCAALAIPIVRRVSGGGTVVQGPGCLNYTLVLPSELLGPSIDLVSSYHFVLEKHRAVCEKLVERPIQVSGISDLVVERRKFSGNAQYRKRRFTLFHGTFLLNFDLALITELLPFPSKQPDYRKSRAHADFLCNLGLATKTLSKALQHEWQAHRAATMVPEYEIAQLAASRYARKEWNEKF